jgi:hypothetical protein
MKKSRSILGLIVLTTMFSSSFAVASTQQIEEPGAYGASFKIGMLTPNPPKVENQSYVRQGVHVHLDNTPNFNRTFMAACLDRRQGSERNKEENISGAIVGYDNGLSLGNGSCVQHVLVRTLRKNADNGGVRYVVLSYRHSCEASLPHSLFVGSHPQLSVSAVRDPGCDASLEYLMFMTQMDPEGNTSKLPLLKLIDESESTRVPRDIKLPCYILKRIHPIEK